MVYYIVVNLKIVINFIKYNNKKMWHLYAFNFNTFFAPIKFSFQFQIGLEYCWYCTSYGQCKNDCNLYYKLQISRVNILLQVTEQIFPSMQSIDWKSNLNDFKQKPRTNNMHNHSTCLCYFSFFFFELRGSYVLGLARFMFS